MEEGELKALQKALKKDSDTGREGLLPPPNPVSPQIFSDILCCPFGPDLFSWTFSQQTGDSLKTEVCLDYNCSQGLTQQHEAHSVVSKWWINQQMRELLEVSPKGKGKPLKPLKICSQFFPEMLRCFFKSPLPSMIQHTTLVFWLMQSLQENDWSVVWWMISHGQHFIFLEEALPILHICSAYGMSEPLCASVN